MTLSSGLRVGAYEFVRPIGAGGMGEVYLAHDARLNRGRRDQTSSAPVHARPGTRPLHTSSAENVALQGRLLSRDQPGKKFRSVSVVWRGSRANFRRTLAITAERCAT